MNAGPNIAQFAALIADPARSTIVLALMDGRARTATELSYLAGVTPQTTSSHLNKLTDGGLLAVARQGRHRYYRIADPDVADRIETMMAVAGETHPAPRWRGGEGLRTARTCYDHFAGRLGVALADAMTERGVIEPAGDDFALTPDGERFLDNLGVDHEAARSKRRAFARQCIDWSERRPHLAGALGAAVTERFFDRGWATRERDSREVVITNSGQRALKQKFGISLAEA